MHAGEAKAFENLPMFFRSSYPAANEFDFDLLCHPSASSTFRYPVEWIISPTLASHVQLAVFPLCLYLLEILAASLGDLIWATEQAQSLNRRFYYIVRIV